MASSDLGGFSSRGGRKLPQFGGSFRKCLSRHRPEPRPHLPPPTLSTLGLPPKSRWAAGGSPGLCCASGHFLVLRLAPGRAERGNASPRAGPQKWKEDFALSSLQRACQLRSPRRNKGNPVPTPPGLGVFRRPRGFPDCSLTVALKLQVLDIFIPCINSRGLLRFVKADKYARRYNSKGVTSFCILRD